MELGLRGRKALVTAASRGLGRACAEALAAEGAAVFIAARDELALKELNQRIGGAGYRATDLSLSTEVEALVAAASGALGGLDILVVNAGGAPAGTLEQIDDDAFEMALQLTTMSAVRLWRHAIPHLRHSDQGRIVNITSAFVKEPSSQLLLSNAFRPGVTAMAKMLSAELAPAGITVNCIAPTALLTDRTRSIAASAAERSGRSIDEQLKVNAAAMPMGRYGEASELAAICAFLCSAQAGYVSGQTIVIDGGAGKSIF
ncbi:MAG TPA: SDR family oxidoreductase [Candidatus Dormibacteraeota bacterium]|nr:SDR family oxidoreductase [Candidatus Dormibacteraeota bacterium]